MVGNSRNQNKNIVHCTTLIAVMEEVRNVTDMIKSAEDRFTSYCIKTSNPRENCRQNSWVAVRFCVNGLLMAPPQLKECHSRNLATIKITYYCFGFMAKVIIKSFPYQMPFSISVYRSLFHAKADNSYVNRLTGHTTSNNGRLIGFSFVLCSTRPVVCYNNRLRKIRNFKKIHFIIAFQPRCLQWGYK